MARRSLAEVKGSGPGPKTVADGCQAWPATPIPEQGLEGLASVALRRSGLAAGIT